MTSKQKLLRSMIPVPTRSAHPEKTALSRSNPFLAADSYDYYHHHHEGAQEISLEKSKNRSASISQLSSEILSAGVSVAKNIEKFQVSTKPQQQPWSNLVPKFLKKNGSETPDTAYSSDLSSSDRKQSCSSSSSSSSSCSSKSASAYDIKICNTSHFTNSYGSSPPPPARATQVEKPTIKTIDDNRQRVVAAAKTPTTTTNRAATSTATDTQNKSGRQCTVISMSTATTQTTQTSMTMLTTTTTAASEAENNYDNYEQSGQLCPLQTTAGGVEKESEKKLARLARQLQDRENKIRELYETTEEKEKLVSEVYHELEKRDQRISAFVEEIRKRKADMIRMSKRIIELDQEVRHFRGGNRGVEYRPEPIEVGDRFEIKTRPKSAASGRPESHQSCPSFYNEPLPSKWIRKILRKPTEERQSQKKRVMTIEYVEELKGMLREKEMAITDLRLETKLANHRLCKMEEHLRRKEEESYVMKRNNDYLEKVMKSKMLD